jgi:hypothetical protein
VARRSGIAGSSQRLWLLKWSAALTGGSFVFFSAAPALRYLLSYDEAFGLIKILMPVFTGYVATAVYFVTQREPNAKERTVSDANTFAAIVKWPIAAFCIYMGVLLVTFAVSNRDDF